MKHAIHSRSVWDACGNIIGIIELDHGTYGKKYSCSDNMELRSHLALWGKQYACDSIMLLTQTDNADVHAEVFEPNAGTPTLPGGISSMCGNGIRAVGAFSKAKNRMPHKSLKVSTLSGTRTVTVEGNDRYSCDMGEFHDSPKAMHKYSTQTIKEQTFRETLNAVEVLVGCPVLHYGIGLSGNADSQGNVDGEPHLVLIFDSSLYNDQSQSIGVVAQVGKLLTKNLVLFPHEINTNVSFIKEINTHVFELYNFTFERNLGNDPVRSITKSCGTGATALAGVLSRHYTFSAPSRIVVHNMGGKLEVTKKDNSLHLAGNAIRIG
ncbi:hypothetical protein KBB12_02775 [Candidatus Woesebacteria bacterium]|nr:hypothetical protein [Candidatus Woesebacteria bacterium]